MTLYVGGTSASGAPVINGIDGPASLSVGQTGTWTVRVNTANTGNLSYSVVWGDERWGMGIGDIQSAAAPTIAASGSFTHAYQSAGTYKPTFTVSNSSGSAQTSASVTVGGSTSPSFSASPTSGGVPLYVTFRSPIPNGSSASDYSIVFGDGTSGVMYPNGTSCIALDGVSCPVVPITSMYSYHTYSSSGTYTAQLIKSSPGGCGAVTNPQCLGAPSYREVVGTVVITVGGDLSNTQRINAPASATLVQGQIAEVRNRQFYFSLQSLGAGFVTIQATSVGCWNGWPSDPLPDVVCMMYPIPIPPVTLTIGQSTTVGTTQVTLTGIYGNAATITVY